MSDPLEKAKLLAEEPHTATPWWPATSVGMNDAVLLSVPAGGNHKEGDMVDHETAKIVARFARPADARRAAVCIARFDGIETRFIEAMPETVREMSQRILSMKIFSDAVQSAAHDDDAWDNLRKIIVREVEEASKSKAH